MYTFRELGAEWLEYQKGYIKESTFALYHYQLNKYIFPVLGELYLDDITEKVLQNMIFVLANEQKSSLSENSIKSILTLTRSCLKYGDVKGYAVYKNHRLRLPKTAKAPRQIQTFNVREQKLIIASIIGDLSCKNFGILLSLYTGLRIGEVCALQWQDFDMESRTLHVRKTVQRIYKCEGESKEKTRLSIAAPKTVTSIREIPISSCIYDAADELRSDRGTDYVLTNSEKVMEPRVYREFYHRFLERNHLRVLKYHSLRHTFATRCIEMGTDYKTVSELLGHANISITLNLYVHPDMEMKRKCVEKIYKDNEQ